jgi:NADH dehydrogenase [ubiquinone] 1 alpha subcomplex assembly factor 7
MPGEVDISAYVDFAALSGVVSKQTTPMNTGILPQGFFLETMGISARVQTLSDKNPTKSDMLAKDYERLASPDHMGEIYKCLYIGSKELGEVYPFTDYMSYEKK